jgi:hypothetical protein
VLNFNNLPSDTETESESLGSDETLQPKEPTSCSSEATSPDSVGKNIFSRKRATPLVQVQKVFDNQDVLSSFNDIHDQEMEELKHSDTLPDSSDDEEIVLASDLLPVCDEFLHMPKTLTVRVKHG